MQPAPVGQDAWPYYIDLAFAFRAPSVCLGSASFISFATWYVLAYFGFTSTYRKHVAIFFQSSDMGVKQKSELNSRLEEKTNQMAATIKQLEQR